MQAKREDRLTVGTDGAQSDKRDPMNGHLTFLISNRDLKIQ